MSIIQEALRKAQGEYVEKKMPDIRVSFRPKIEVRAKPNAKRPLSIRLLVMLGVLTAVVLIYVLMLSLQHPKARGKEPAAAGKAAALSAAQAQTIFSAADVKPAEPKRDPGSGPKNDAAPQPVVFVLNGIMYVESRPQAIINGHVLEEGDKINGATVLAIEKDCVLLDLNSANIRLDLDKQS